jgi:hypothetical protein
MMDAFSSDTTVLNPTVKNIGGLDMRQGGELDIPTMYVPSFKAGMTPYQVGQVKRNTVWIYNPNQPLYELIDPNGEIFIMQSISQIKAPTTPADLPKLGSELNLPQGWIYRQVIPKETVQVAAVNGVAHVTQDDLSNTYQLSQLR